MLKSHDLLDVIRIGRTAMECGQVDELRREVVGLLRDAFRVEKINFFLARQYPSPRLDLEHVISLGLDKKYLTLFGQRYYKTDPFFKTFDSPKTVVTTGNVIPFEDLIKSEYYNDFLEPQSIHYQMTIYLRSGGKLLGTLAMFRSKHEKDFSLHENAKGKLLASQLAGALEKSIYIDKVNKSKEVINSICPDLPYKGLIVLDESLEPVYINEEARKTIPSLTEARELWEDSLFPLPKELYIQCKQLTERSKQRADASTGGKARILDKNTGQTVSTNLRLINYSRDSGLYLICMNQNDSGALLANHLKQFGLTRRELEVTVLVCEGFKNSEIGEKLFISEYTVENHLRSIYEKLGVKNRTSLAYKVMYLTGQK
ncbi:MAG: Transcriptional regulatory protein LiaR [Syntrophorhabdus sp. PtaU1.Bin058]|nr:MAG: Transcriptional regulatory protein LiaR [Syntrophorhabdus sp. PtaU1.Bin058]